MSDKMKALTLWQPWASLIAQGNKKFETRSWATYYRGPLLIHAAKRIPRKGDANQQIVTALKDSGIKQIGDLPFGAAICTVYLLNIFRVEDVLDRGWISPEERDFGDYSPGRFAWQFVNLCPMPTPIPMIGRQGLWTAEIEAIMGPRIITEQGATTRPPHSPGDAKAKEVTIKEVFRFQ